MTWKGLSKVADEFPYTLSLVRENFLISHVDNQTGSVRIYLCEFEIETITFLFNERASDYPREIMSLHVEQIQSNPPEILGSGGGGGGGYRATFTFKRANLAPVLIIAMIR